MNKYKNKIDPEIIVNQIAILTDGENAIKILLGTVAVLMLLAIKGLFFTSKPESNGKEGIVLENTSGKLVISKESLENLIASVTKEVPGADTVASRTILDKRKNLIVYVTAVVSKDVMLKDISNELQSKIKGLPSPVDDVAKNTAEEDSNIEKNTEEEKNEENDVGEE